MKRETECQPHGRRYSIPTAKGGQVGRSMVS
jgi:hypothetical protein